MRSSTVIQDLISFLDISPTSWHAVAVLEERLKNSGFHKLYEQEIWEIQPERLYFVIRESSICAFVTPSRMPKRIRLLASHTDSPSFKIKPQGEIRKFHTLLLGVEVYGSPILSSWFNRDLGIAGRVFYVNRKGQIKDTLVCIENYPVTIPHLAIHLDREVNEKGLQINKQEHLNAIVGLENQCSQDSFIEAVLKEEILDFEHLIGHELFLFPLEKARLIGYKNAFLAAYRIDSLASVHAALTALLRNLEPLEDEMKMIIFWDHEEVGSHTAQGAKSTFFSQTVERILNAYEGTREDYFCLLNRSTCVSIDMAHALHPNYSEKHDASHQPLLGEGIVLKSNAQQRYATSAKSLIPVQVMGNILHLPLQKFVSRNDIPCGTTIGPLQACITGMSTADIGCGQLSMHACRELMACQDHLDMCMLLEGLLTHSP